MSHNSYCYTQAQKESRKGESSFSEEAFGVPRYGSFDKRLHLQMTLNLYERINGKFETHFNWAPTQKQWWINGFIPDPDWMDTMFCNGHGIYLCNVTSCQRQLNRHQADRMVTLGTMDFSISNTHKGMYYALKESNDPKVKDYMIFNEDDDDDYTVWVIWWNKKVLR